MTCIIALTDRTTVWIGGDSAGVAGLNLEIRDDSKVFRREDKNKNIWAFGFTTSFRMGQLIRYDLELPELTAEDEQNIHRFMVKKFIPALRKCLAAGGWQSKKEDREVSGKFLIGLRGNIFTIDSDYQVAIPHNAFTAVGAGENIALGALFVSGDKLPEERILNALEAAETFSTVVRKPFNIVTT
ncbi:MAG: hypothetical protein UT82_C0009G0025 [Parcubacteria group bacterium GW2011_GWB1_40_14]|nr:MAG: hypothetical protein UT82_C0009G0025 [Parcubacteria group bacterium GW2011_GWB1_40_14]